MSLPRNTLTGASSFFRYARYYLPGLFPVAIVCALVIARLPKKITIPDNGCRYRGGSGLVFPGGAEPACLTELTVGDTLFFSEEKPVYRQRQYQQRAQTYAEPGQQQLEFIHFKYLAADG